MISQSFQRGAVSSSNLTTASLHRLTSGVRACRLSNLTTCYGFICELSSEFLLVLSPTLARSARGPTHSSSSSGSNRPSVLVLGAGFLCSSLAMGRRWIMSSRRSSEMSTMH